MRSTVEHGRMYKFDVHFKTMYVSGVYSIDGRILLLPITGSGNFTGRFSKPPPPTQRVAC